MKMFGGNTYIWGVNIMHLIKGYILIGMAGCLWGTLGWFEKMLLNLNFPFKLAVFCRLFIGFIFLFVIICLKDISLLKINKKALKYTALIGFFSQAIFNLLYIQTIEKTTIATAVVLLYTAPIFLIIMGRIFYNEKFSRAKICALLFCVIGCILTVTGGNFSMLRANIWGITFGVGAGFTYALVTIFSKALIEDVHPLTIILYSFGFGSLFLIPYTHPEVLIHMNFKPMLILMLLGLGLIPTAFSYILYIKGLTMGVEVSKAGIICSMEIVVSVIISSVVFREVILNFKLIGILLVILSIGAVQFDKKAVKNEYVELDSAS
jgi:drug/metabolite transporter (DMT)-like permease